MRHIWHDTGSDVKQPLNRSDVVVRCGLSLDVEGLATSMEHERVRQLHRRLGQSGQDLETRCSAAQQVSN